MRIAYTIAPGRGDTDLLLQQLATSLAKTGIKACGVVQINSMRHDFGPCDMDVKVLPDGPVLRISQSLGSESRGCRLDPAALEEAVALSAAELKRGADVLIVNKFGKHEAEGRGFRTLIADALGREVPVLAGVNALNIEAFKEFVQGVAICLPSEIIDLQKWVELQMSPIATGA